MSPQTHSKGIPDIVLTSKNPPSNPASCLLQVIEWLMWCLAGVDELSRQDFARELGNAIVGMPDIFDVNLLPSDEALKDGLDPLDFTELQMLADSTVVADPDTERAFRIDTL